MGNQKADQQFTVIVAKTEYQFSTGNTLINEYTAWVMDCFIRNGMFNIKHYDQIKINYESIETEYACYNGGCLMIAYENNQPVGCGAIKKVSETKCELKRLFVRPSCQTKGIGKKLVSLLIQKAQNLHYSSILLSSHDFMKKGITLYRKFGFKEIPAYHDYPIQGTLFFELRLDNTNETG